MMTSSIAGRLQTVPTTTAKEILRDLGVNQVLVRGLSRLTEGTSPVAAIARTLRYLPARGDVPAPESGRLHRAFIDRLDAGQILVIDAIGNRDVAVLGDMLAGRAAARGAVGAIVDGAIRDLSGVAALGLTMFARGVHPDASGGVLAPWEVDVPIQCGGALVKPGDWILADSDAVLVVPAQLVEELLVRAKEVLARDEFSQHLLGLGHRLPDAYPIPANQEDAFQRFLQDGTLPTPPTTAG
jgi:regulator of RNase E activity RraA